MTGTFPILPDFRDSGQMRETIPWAAIAPHERQAEQNHYQTLKRLAERGGLSWCEALAVLEDRPWSKVATPEAKQRVEAIIAAMRLAP